jgi:hypothetical protein
LTLLHGIVAPEGEGLVVEVHLDIMEVTTDFLKKLNRLGFENDPFLDFYPPGYYFHYTGRARVVERDLARELPAIDSLITQIIDEAREQHVKMYAECELVRDIRHFSDQASIRNLFALDCVTFETSSMAEPAKADIHVEFRSGAVPQAVRELLSARGFYWVRTPASDRFPSEEIATVQTSVFRHARQVYDRMVASPLPGCTGIHLEQKLTMRRSCPDVPLPPVMEAMMKQDSMAGAL